VRSYASGRTTGLSVVLGEGGVWVLPVYEGRGLPHGLRTSDVGGKDVTDLLQFLMTERGYSFTTTSEREIVRDLKEKYAYVARDLEAEMRKPTSTIEKGYELPDGQVRHLRPACIALPRAAPLPRHVLSSHARPRAVPAARACVAAACPSVAAAATATLVTDT
jgi:hypothetical protein